MKDPRSNFGVVVASWLWGPNMIFVVMGAAQWLKGESASSIPLELMIPAFAMWLRWATARESEYLQDTVDKLRVEVENLRRGWPQ